MTILVTGGAGFIGSNLLHHLVKNVDQNIVCVDKFGYASDLRLIEYLDIEIEHADISNRERVFEIFEKHKPTDVFHLAAESHVDNSIKNSQPFVFSNVVGTVNLLDAARDCEVNRFMHISTDEVYGSIAEGSFREDTPYDPRNPYSASKASSDHFVSAYHNTYGLPTIITNCSNNYGPRQHHEKMIPKIIHNIWDNKKIPVYGDGQQIRDWLYVDDHCEALIKVWKRGKVGEKYNIGGECEITNIELVKRILFILDKDPNMIEYVQDRPGHDRRYSTDITKIKNEIGWSPRYTLSAGLYQTLNWYYNRIN
jgi:dTDP-glucose 4,6-dehydratase